MIVTGAQTGIFHDFHYFTGFEKNLPKCDEMETFLVSDIITDFNALDDSVSSY